jgi:hypothetical protein
MRPAKQFLFFYKMAVHVYISLLVYYYKNNVSTNDVDWLQEIWGAFFLTLLPSVWHFSCSKIHSNEEAKVFDS